MAINATDIKLLESENMADTTDGGGRKTSRVIPDGVAGNIFPKVSRLDSVYGRVNLRKVYGAVQTANTDTYAGAHAVITDAPDNADIHTTLFSTSSEFDTRTAARDRIESYVTSGPESRMVLLGRQLPGQQTFMAYQRVEEPLVDVGTVLCLSNEPGSIVTTQQYVRVQDVTSEVRTFEDARGTFERRVVTVDVGVALRYEFNGPPYADRMTQVAKTSIVRNTTVVDAARYFGIQKLAEAANQNDLTVRVNSVYTPIVPTTNRETAVSNQHISNALNMVATTATPLSETLSAFASGSSRYTRRGILPGSLTISGSGITAVTDNQLGSISNSTFAATIDYENGTINRTGGSAGAVEVTANYTPAASATQPAHTIDVKVKLGNRGTIYALTLNPLPSPGSIIVDYRALGKWYRLRDNGDGSLSGADAAYGIGTVTYNTGAMVLSLGALPDVDSSVIVSWGSPMHYAIRAGVTSDASTQMRQSFSLPNLPVTPDSVSLTYTSGGTPYTATDNAAGVISGNGITGTVNYTTGEVNLEYSTRLPDASTNVAVSYQQITPNNPQLPVARSLSLASGANMSLNDGVAAGSMLGTIVFSGHPLVVADNGSGLLVVKGGQQAFGGNGQAITIAGDTVVGTINYTTGDLVVNASVSGSTQAYGVTAWATDSWFGQEYQKPAGYGWSPAAATLTVGTGTANISWKSSTAAGSNTAKSIDITFSAAPIQLNLTATVGDSVTPGSVMFSAGGKTFIDRNGQIYADVSTTTGAGTYSGNIDYATGEVSLTSWTNGANLAMSVATCLTVYGSPTATLIFFRTPGAPLRPGSLYVQVSDANGELVTGQANSSGVITGTKVTGTVDQTTGVVRLLFGSMVAAAGNEAEPWYNAAVVVAGQIFKPIQVQPGTLTYNCVVLANLPLNADILGLDPVRLPVDGRVPIYRPADVVVIHNTQSPPLTNPVVAGNTYSVGRANLSEVQVIDQNGVALLDNQYTYSLTAGTVTIAGNFTAGSLVQPLIARNRVEDMSLVTDVQINGQITLAAPLSRAYDVNSFVSSALMFGDMNGRVTGVYDLGAFSSWSDIPGSGAAAQYNNIDYPIEVLNNGAVTERWRINFTNTTTFQVIGENLGVIATGTTSADCSPTNQLTGQPYFVIRAAGWGAGWAAGNQLRFNTISAAAPIWIARTVLPGATLEGDSFSMQMRGDVDAV
jgi:hypothetical protein